MFSSCGAISSPQYISWWTSTSRIRLSEGTKTPKKHRLQELSEHLVTLCFLNSLFRLRNKLFKKQRVTKKFKDVEHYKQIKTKVQKAERPTYWQHLEIVIDFGDPDSEDRAGKQKWFWSFVKSLKKDNSGIAPLKEKGKMHAEPTDKANILNRQYESVYTKEDDREQVPRLEGQPYHGMPDITVTMGGVWNILKKINPSKACGPDMILARLLRDMANVIAPVL